MRQLIGGQIPSSSNEDEPDWTELFPVEDSSSESGDELDLEFLDDLKLSIGLLGGVHDVGKDGLPKKRYLSGNQEFVARKALARLLRSSNPVDGVVRSLLAALIDPEGEVPPYSSFDLAPIERRIVITGRQRGGGMIQNLRRLELAVAVTASMQRNSAQKRDDAIHEVAERFSVSTRKVEEALAYLGKTLGAN